MKTWESLYSILKLTREEKDNTSVKDERYLKRIRESITINDIENMKSIEVKEAVINYLKALVPGIRDI